MQYILILHVMYSLYYNITRTVCTVL